jgi:hypothetical protein
LPSQFHYTRKASKTLRLFLKNSSAWELLVSLTTPAALVVMRWKAQELSDQCDGGRCTGRKKIFLTTTAVERRKDMGKQSFVEDK